MESPQKNTPLIDKIINPSNKKVTQITDFQLNQLIFIGLWRVIQQDLFALDEQL
jgi:hypothetical protein